MNQGGDVAEQVLRMSLGGVEVTAKIAGAAAKQIAVLLYTLLKQQHKWAAQKLFQSFCCFANAGMGGAPQNRAGGNLCAH